LASFNNATEVMGTCFDAFSHRAENKWVLVVAHADAFLRKTVVVITQGVWCICSLLYQNGFDGEKSTPLNAATTSVSA
jgi:hypothetical protein